jgi:hypothetical protein
MDLDPRGVDRRVPGELRVDGVGPAHELDVQRVRPRAERLGDPFDFRPGGVIAPHGVHRDADHAQASSTSTTFLPR